MDLKLSVQAISDEKMLAEMAKELDNFLISNSRNPFELSEFMKGKFKDVLAYHIVPLVLVLKVDGKIVGVAPLSIRKKFGIRFARTLFSFESSPDFTFDRAYSEVCMKAVLNYVFNRLHCLLVTLELSADSLNLPILERECKLSHVSIYKLNNPNLNHAVISVTSTWEGFQKQKSPRFQRKFRKIEQGLSNAGQLRFQVFENENNEEETPQRILGVEETSWKQNWRLQNRLTTDHALLRLWRESSLAIRTYKGFKRSVWFLELGGHDIAYSLVFEYKGTAYFAKTSYNNEFRHLAPGIFLNNVVVANLFSSGNVKIIDFMTCLRFHQIWTSTSLLRFRALLWKGFFPGLIALAVQQPRIRNFIWHLSHEFIEQIE